MSVDRRAEAAMGLEEILAVQGYAIVPLLMQRIPDTENFKNSWDATELPLKDKGYEQVYLGWLQPFLQDPFRPQHESRFGRFLIYDPKAIKVKWVMPLNGYDLSDEPDRLREEGYSVIDVTGSEGRIIVGIARKSDKPVVQVSASIY